MKVLRLPRLGHPGVEEIKMVTQSNVWWPSMNQHITLQVRECKECQGLQRVPRCVETAPSPFLERSWSRLNVNFGGPFRGHYLLVVVVDMLSKWVEVLPVTTSSSEASVWLLRQVFAAQGMPDFMISDNDPAFASEGYLALLTKNVIRRLIVPPCHTASSGTAERWFTW